jgi:hypothetical protein
VETQMVQFECSEKIQENLILGPPPPLRALHGQRRTQKRHSPSTRQVSEFVVETKSDMCEFYSYFLYQIFPDTSYNHFNFPVKKAEKERTVNTDLNS